MSPLHSRRSPNKGGEIRSGYLTPVFLRAQKRAEMRCHPCILGGHQTKGDKISIDYLTHAVSGAQKMPQKVCHPCILEDPPTKGAKSELAASPLPS